MDNAIWDSRRLRIATDAAGVALWSWNVDTDRIAMDERAYELWGVPVKDEITFEELSARIHPEDLDKVRAAFAATRELVGAYETDFRILHGSEIRWVSARGRGDDQGIISRIMFGVFLDVTVRKLAEEAREMVTGEMQHRIRNLFALTDALATISSSVTGTKEEMARDFRERLTALSAAHDLIHPPFGEQKRAVHLADLIAALLRAYSKGPPGLERVAISAPEVLVGEQGTTAIAMIVHELATNSAKYGALSEAEGKIDVSCIDRENEVEVVWTESGGPPAETPSGQPGFGSQLIARVLDHIGASMIMQWPREGAVATLRINKARLGA